jgi:hypothetical protein
MENASGFSATVSDGLVVDDGGGDDEEAEEEEASTSHGKIGEEPPSSASVSSRSEPGSSEAYTPTLQPPAYDRVDLAYKQRVVEYRRSAKKRPRSVAAVMKKFRQCKSNSMYYEWEATVDGGGKRNRLKSQKLLSVSSCCF